MWQNFKFAFYLSHRFACTFQPKNSVFMFTPDQSARKTPLPAHLALMMSTHVKGGDRCGDEDCKELVRVFHDKSNKQFFIDLSPHGNLCVLFKYPCL